MTDTRINTGPADYVYRDRKLGDVEAITIATAPDVFHPTSTSVLLLRAARRLMDRPPRTTLDLGCGSGIVAVVLARVFGRAAAVSASDLSDAAVRLTRHNAERNGVAIECRSGSLFDPWVGRRFDLIVDDVAGVAEPLDRLSGWYPNDVPSDAGPDGARWILEILDHAADHLETGGRLIFPVLTLSRDGVILERARARFHTVRLLEQQWYPLSETLAGHLPLIESLQAEGWIRLERHGSRWCWATMIYEAGDPA